MILKLLQEEVKHIRMVVFKSKVQRLVFYWFCFWFTNIWYNNYINKCHGNIYWWRKLIASDSTETGGLIENSGNTDITISSGTDGIVTKRFSDARQVFMDDDSGQRLYCLILF